MISIRNVHKSFGPQVVLDGITLDIDPETTTAVVGPSGVGKSVLLKIILGVLPPDAGEVFICGENITKARTELERNRIRESMGVLFQSAALFDSLTVYENVEFPLINRMGFSRRQAHEKVTYMLEALSLEEHAWLLPGEISMGMRKRVGMARALVLEPKILLFDEPNTGLDPLVGQEVYDLIKWCKEKWHITGVVISHELPEVFQVSDRVVMLLKGKIIFEGPPKELTFSADEAVQQFLNGRIDGPIKIQ